MSTKDDVTEALTKVSDSLTELEQAALEQATQTDIVIQQGQSVSKTLGELVSKMGELTDRLGHYLENADKQGGRINTLERKLRDLSADAE
jgi:polyhydroxyalkanoate synthesis regulator phasin